MSGGCIDSETPRPPSAIARAFQNPQVSEGARDEAYRISTAVTTPHGEGRMPGAAEDVRPGRLPKVACSEVDQSAAAKRDKSNAGRGASPLGGEGRGNIAAPLPDR